MIPVPTPEWMESFRQAVNTDREMLVIGRWCDTEFTLSFDDETYWLQVREGQIRKIEHAPAPEVTASFGLRAPIHVWRRFINPEPPPLYHDFFAMLMRVPEFNLDGDVLSAMQNARALHRMMTILGNMEPPDG